MNGEPVELCANGAATPRSYLWICYIVLQSASTNLKSCVINRQPPLALDAITKLILNRWRGSD